MPTLEQLLDEVDASAAEIVELERQMIQIPTVNTGQMPTGNETPLAEFIRGLVPRRGDYRYADFGARSRTWEHYRRLSG